MGCRLSGSGGQRAAVRKHDDAVGGNYGDHRRRKAICHEGRFLSSSVVKGGDGPAAERGGSIALTHREVPGVLVVDKRFVADAEAAAHYQFFSQAVGHAEAWSEVAI